MKEEIVPDGISSPGDNWIGLLVKTTARGLVVRESLEMEDGYRWNLKSFDDSEHRDLLARFSWAGRVDLKD